MIGLVACCKSKRTYKCQAKNMYLSPLFKYSYKYLEQLNCDRIYILSAKYGLLHPNTYIYPYDEVLTRNTYIDWSNRVNQQLISENIIDEQFVILAGNLYYSKLSIKNKVLPLEHMGIGQRLSYLKCNTM